MSVSYIRGFGYCAVFLNLFLNLFLYLYLNNLQGLFKEYIKPQKMESVKGRSKLY